jgi:hypothetical protein
LGLFRLLIIEIFNFEYLTKLLDYLNQRYPRIKTAKRLKDNQTTKFILQRENSKINVHNILNLFDPQLKTKAIPPPPPEIIIATKTPITFKRLGTRIATLNTFSKTQIGKKRPSFTATRVN